MSEESVAHAIIEQNVLEDYIETVHSLVLECKLHMSGDGFHVSAVEPSNVAMIHKADLDPRAFEAFDAPGTVTQGINLERLLEFIGPADSGDLVELNLNMETRKLEIHYGATDHSMALIDPETVRTEPDISDLDLPNTVIIEGSDLRHAIDAVGLSSDHVFIRGNVDDRQIEFFGQGDTDNSSVAYSDEAVVDADVDADVESVFSLTFLEMMSKPIPADAEVTLEFGDEFPLRLSYQAADGAMDVEMMCAPRIQTK